MSEYKYHNADINLRYDATVDDLIDVIEGNRVYIPCLYVLNKIDQLSLEELDLLDRIPHYVPISGKALLSIHLHLSISFLFNSSYLLTFLSLLAHLEWNLDSLLEKMWEYLDLVRMYVTQLLLSSPLFFSLTYHPSFLILSFVLFSSPTSYTKPKGQIPDYNAPVVMRRNCSVEDFCNKLHRTILRQLK